MQHLKQESDKEMFEYGKILHTWQKCSYKSTLWKFRGTEKYNTKLKSGKQNLCAFA